MEIWPGCFKVLLDLEGLTRGVELRDILRNELTKGNWTLIHPSVILHSGPPSTRDLTIRNRCLLGGLVSTETADEMRKWRREMGPMAFEGMKKKRSLESVRARARTFAM